METENKDKRRNKPKQKSNGEGSINRYKKQVVGEQL